MQRIPRPSFDDNLFVHRFGEREWGEPDPVPLVTVALGDRSALLRLTDSDAPIPLTDAQWSRAEEVARRVATLDADVGPVLFMSRALIVAVPMAAAEPLARLLLSIAQPAGSLP